MFSTKYSVSDIAAMLRVNEETVRRWIRDGKLKAESAKGRGGNTIYIKDVVDFVNTPPREYLLPLETWLKDNNIPYKTFVEEDKADKKKAPKLAAGLAAVTTANIASASISATAPVVAGVAAVPIAGPIVAMATAATAAQIIKKKKTKSYPNYIIVLLDPAEFEETNEGEITDDKTAAEVEFANAADTWEPENATEATTEQGKEPNVSEEALTATSVLDEIARAKQMVDMGIFTEEEFAEIKAKLIAKL